MFTRLKEVFSLSLGLTILFFLSSTANTIKTTGLKGSELEISHKEFNQQNPAVLYIKEDNVWFVVWEDYRNGNADIYGRIVKSDGTMCDEIPLVVHSNSEQTHPSLAYKPNDKILLVWQDSRGSASDGYVYYGGIDISGADLSTCPSLSLASENSTGYSSINGDSLVSRKKPKAAYNSVDDKFYITWIETRDKQKWFSANCFSTTIVNTYSGDTEFVGFATVTSNLTSETTGIFRTDFGSFTGVDTTGRVISISRETTKETYIFEIIDQIENPYVSIDYTSNEILFVWEGIRKKVVLTCSWTDVNSNNTVDPGEVGYTLETSLMDTFIDEYPTREHKHIYALFLKNKNHAMYSYKIDNVSVMDNSDNDFPYDAYYPSVAFDPVSKRFLIVWEINDFDRANPEIDNRSKIYGQLLYSGGGLYGTNILISYEDRNGDDSIDEQIANSKQTKPYVSYDPVNQRFFVVWQDARNQTESKENIDLYGQFVDPEGTLRGTNFEISTHPSNQLSPVISFNFNENTYLSVWKDARNLNSFTCGTTNDKPCGSDIYGQRFSLGNPQLTIMTEDRKILAPSILDFGYIKENTIKTLTLILRNSGDTSLDIDCVTLTGTGFNVRQPAELQSCDSTYLTLLPSEEVQIFVTFSPSSEGFFSGTLTIQTIEAGNKSVALTGKSVATSITHDESDGTNDNTLDFGNVKVGNSKTLSIIITNNGDADIKIVSISSLQEPFSILSPDITVLPITLSKGESTSIDIEYLPTERGVDIQTLHIATDNPKVSLDITVKGKAVAPELSVDKLVLDFGSVDVGNTVTKNIVISNTGDYTLTGISCSLSSAEFKLVSVCPQKLDPGASQTLNIEFTPSSIGTKSATLTINSDGGNASVSLLGNGAGGVLNISNTNLDFGYVKVGGFSVIDLAISNAGNKPLTINNINTGSLGSVFSVDLNAPVTLNPGDSVSFKVKFEPTASNFYTGSFTVESSAGNQTVYVKGHGVQTNISISSSTLNFGDVNVGETKEVILTIENDSVTDVVINDIGNINPPFSISSTLTLPYTLKPSEKVVIKFAFSPVSYGSFNQSILIVTDSGNLTVQLQGTGKAPDISVTPISLDFGKVSIGNSKTQIITVKNNGNEPFDITGCYNESEFFEIVNCSVQTVTSSSPVQIEVKFTPSNLGTVEDSIVIYTTLGKYTVSVKGTGKGGILSVSNTGLDFGFIKVGNHSVKELTITNAGDEPLTLNNIDTSSLNSTVFSIDGLISTPVTLNPGDSLSLRVRFSPTDTQSYTGSFTIESSIGNRTIYIKGTGVQSNISYPGSLSFGNVNVGETKEKVVRIKNTSDVEVEILSIYGLTTPFSISNLPSLPKKLSPSEEILLNVVFEPTQFGNVSQKLNIETDTGTLPIDVTGTGVFPVVKISPIVIDFGDVNIGSSVTQIVTVKNEGNSPFDLIDCTINEPAFKVNNCQNQSIDSGDYVSINVSFIPSKSEIYSDELLINTSLGVFKVKLKGTGKGGSLEISNSSVSFGNVRVGNSKVVEITVKNNGNQTATISSINSIGLPSQFSLDLPIPTSIPPGTEVTFTVTFSPDSEGVFTGNFTLDSNFNDLTVNLSGKGYKPDIEIILPEDFDFGDTLDFLDISVGESRTKSVRIKNTSHGNVTLKQIDMPAEPFEVVSQIELPLTLKPGEYIDVDIRFSPQEAGTFNTSVGLLFDTHYEPFIVFLKGNGIGKDKQIAPKGNILFKLGEDTISNFNFGKVLVGKSKTVILKIKNDGTSDITINQYILTDSVDFSVIGLNTPFTLKQGQEKEFKLTFTPQAENTYYSELKLTDSNGAIYQLSVVGTGYPVEVSSDSGTVEDYQVLTVIPYIQNAPDNINIVNGFRFLIRDFTDNKVTVSLEFSYLPHNAIFYKIKGNGEWIKIENALIDKNKVTFTIYDNSDLDLDARTGIIEDPIIIAVPVEQNVSQPTGPTGTTLQPPPSGTGGCNMGTNNSLLPLIVIMLTLFTLIRRFNMRFILMLFMVLPLFYSCKVGGGADVGVSVEVTASTEDVTFVSSDIVNLYDTNENGICGDAGDNAVIPSEETIFVTFRATPINPSVVPSDVRIEKAILEYVPKNSSYPVIEPMTLYIGSTFSAARPISIEIPVIDNEVKRFFFLNNYRGEYFVKVTFTLVEVNYDKELETDIGFTLDIDYRQTEDDECIP